MPIYADEDVLPELTHPTLMPEVQVPEPTFGQTVGAAMRMENDVWNFYDMINRPRMEKAQSFDLVESLKKRNLLNQGEHYLDVYSEAELDWKTAKIKREEKDRRTLAASGYLGLLAQVGAGAASPATLMPFMTGATGVKAVLMGAASVFAGAAAQELVLAQNQETRTKGEIAFSLGASTLLGAALGGLAHSLSKSKLDRLANDMVDSNLAEAISKPAPGSHESAVGADVPYGPQDVGKLKGGAGVTTLSRLPFAQNPIVRGLQQWNAPSIVREMGGSAQLRKMTSGFSQDSLLLEGNKDWRAASPGGNVEDLKRQYAYYAYQGHVALETAYKEMIKGDTSGPAKLARARLAGWMEGRMSYPEFKRQVSLDLWTGFTRDVAPEIRKAAQKIDTEVFKPLYKEGVEANIFTGEEKVVGDKNYASRIYNHPVIERRKNEFIDILAQNFKQRVEAEFTKSAEKFQARKMRGVQTLEDMARPLEEAKKLRAEFEAQLTGLEEKTPLDVVAADAATKEIAKDVRELRAELKALREAREVVPEQALRRLDRMGEIEAQLKQKALDESAMRETLGEDLTKYQAAVKVIRQRMNELSRAHEVVDAKMQVRLDKIEANEEAQINTILRAQKQLDKLDRFLAEGGERLDEELSKAKTQFAEAAKKFDKADEELRALEKEDFGRAEQLTGKIEQLASKMDDFAEKVENFDNFDRQAWKAELEQMKRDLAETHAQLNAKRVLRNERLWKRVEAMSPEARAAREAELRKKMTAREGAFMEAWRARGANAMDVLAGKADFSEISREMAENVTEKILGTERRLAFSDIIREKRGPELARVLDIPSEKIMDFLETDMEKIISIYTRTMGGDLAVSRVFGSADAAKEFSKLNDEKKAMILALKSRKGKDGKPLAGKALEEESQKIEHFYNAAQKDLMVLLERAKGIRGIPKDPESWGYRAAKTAMEVNVLRLMGSTIISSIPDIVRIGMRQGFTRVLKDAIIPMINDWKTIRMSQREAKYAGVALDPLMHTRMFEFGDLFDDAHRGTKLERGIHYATTRFGMMTLIDQWNAALKQITAGVVNARLLDNIAMLMGDVKASPKQLEKAKEFLARNNIDGELAETIWREVTNGEGGGKVNEIWLPNTEAWNIADPAVARARRAYRAALGGEVDATIITPGFGRYAWVDANPLYRVLAQFKSYGITATQKVLMAGLQEHDAKFFTGVALSIGMGMLSAYLWAVSVGGKTYEEMQKWSMERWLDEGISRSGVTGIFDEIQRVAQRIPLLRRYASFSGERTTRREGGDLVEAALGPSFDLIEKSANVITGIDEPTKSTLHQIRLMMFFQNLWYFRNILSKIEEAAGAPLPERRSK